MNLHPELPSATAAALSLLLLTGAAPLAAQTAAGGEDLGIATMKDVSSAYRAIDKALTAGQNQDLAALAAQLGRAAAGIGALAPQRNVEHADNFARRGQRLQALAGELGATANGAAGEPQRILADIRATCVGCHTVFRGDNGTNRNFPARGNTVWGQISLLGMDGEAQMDRANVVVFVDGMPDTFPAPTAHARISQRGRQFSPRVLPVVQGTSVDFPNDDTVFHNVFSLSAPCCFDLDIYEKGASKTVQFGKPGLVQIYCNIHPDMVANVLVLKNPFFGVTDEDGFFVITDVPDGDFSLRSWHEFGEETKTRVTLRDGAHVQASITVQENKKTIKHNDKFGKPYRGKYQ